MSLRTSSGSLVKLWKVIEVLRWRKFIESRVFLITRNSHLAYKLNHTSRFSICILFEYRFLRNPYDSKQKLKSSSASK